MGIIDQWTISTVERQRDTIKLKQIYELQSLFLFNQYEPVLASPSEAALPFISRMDRWLSCFDDPVDQWQIFKSFQYFFFVGKEETDELYRCAVQHKVIPWLADQENIDIFSEDVDNKIFSAVQRTWPCPITDSLRINGLLHRTNFKGQSLRPDWLSLKQFADKEKIEEYVKRRKIDYLVLFEDFVGSGSQCSRAAKFALTAFPGPVLLVPLIICHPGDQLLRKLADDSNGRLTYLPITVLSADCLIGENATANEPQSFKALRKALVNGHNKGNFSDPAFGYGGVGSLISSYSNCPNNSPPVFHGTTSTWQHPLFPRKGRA